jgi:hypothetical protein
LINIAPPRHSRRQPGPPIPYSFVHHSLRMDAKTKWVIAILLFLVLVLLVIGGIMAIASPPDACC